MYMALTSLRKSYDRDVSVEVAHQYLDGKILKLSLFIPLSLQLVSALGALKTVAVIHTNVTLRNIMLVNQKQTPSRVKVTDLSSANEAAEIKRSDLM
ncbi:homeodomain-interacting protein kinase 2-like [Scomber scombrus]|uniref:Homeodomain-interacting protein kinase 2-like n=1 Tax=Scomber scombrus TaxID=13677 RepID=A0AAV1P4N2_SCOSC